MTSLCHTVSLSHGKNKTITVKCALLTLTKLLRVEKKFIPMNKHLYNKQNTMSSCYHTVSFSIGKTMIDLILMKFSSSDNITVVSCKVLTTRALRV